MAGERNNGHVRWTQPGSRELTASGDPGGEAAPRALATGRAGGGAAEEGGPASRAPFPEDPGIRGPLHPRRLRCTASSGTEPETPAGAFREGGQAQTTGLISSRA